MNNRTSLPQSAALRPEFGKIYRHNRHRKLGIETLEPRQVMSASVQMLDVNPNSYWDIAFLTAVGDTLYFSGSDETHGWELWKSDGTIEGTVLVRDINPGPSQAAPQPNPAQDGNVFTHINGTLYFAAYDGVTGAPQEFCCGGMELWKSDGTAKGTVLVRDIVPGLAGSTPVFVTAANDTLFFAATDPVHGTALWTSDGTTEGTTMVKDIIPGTSSSFDQTWWSDPVGQNYGRFVAIEDSLYFFANQDEDSVELWKSNGTADGTFVVKDGFRKATSGMELEGRLLFIAEDEPNGDELWISDGTADGTVAINRSSAGRQQLGRLTNVDGTLYFIVWGEGSVDLWKTDGTQTGTLPVKSFAGYDVDDLTDFNGTLYISLSQDGRREMWRSDGTADGTVHVTSKGRITEGWGEDSFFVVGDTLFFASRQNGKNWLWQSDGTEAGTEQVPDIPGFSWGPVSATVVDDQVFFIGPDDGGSCCELWVLDTSTGGTSLPGDIDGNGSVAFEDFVILANNFGKSPATAADGDLDEDGRVDFSDFVILANNFGRSITPPPVASPAATTAHVRAVDLAFAEPSLDSDVPAPALGAART